MPRELIGLFPQGVRSRRPRLFEALERAYPVTFEERQTDALGGLGGAVVFGEGPAITDKLWTGGIPFLSVPDHQRKSVKSGAEPARIRLLDCSLIEATLRGRYLDDCRSAHVLPVAMSAGDQVLASYDGAPLWVAREEGSMRMDRAAVSPLAAPDGQPLRDQLRQGQFLSLLPLIHFLRFVTRDQEWSYPPLRASFVLDDPNLRWPSYGFLNYPALLQEARRHGYHVAIGMVPLDVGFVRRDLTDLFRGAPDCVSLLIHGNNHSRNELEKLRSDRLALAVLAQAVRRIAALERRSGIPISRVMAAPHERCSEEAMRAMFRLGFEGICIDWRYPWRFRPDREAMLAGFDQAELLAGGLPLLGRDYLANPKEDLVFRAYLNQPLLLYGHHQDLTDGLDILRSAADEVNRLGSVEWSSLSSIARSNFHTRREGDSLAVRMLSRRIAVDVPKDVESLRIETPVVHDGAAGALATVNGHPLPLISTDDGWRSELLAAEGGRVEIVINAKQQIDPASVPPPPRRVWPIFRRAFGESRDRLQPIANARRTRSSGSPAERR